MAIKLTAAGAKVLGDIQSAVENLDNAIAILSSALEVGSFTAKPFTDLQHDIAKIFGNLVASREDLKNLGVDKTTRQS